MSKVLSAAEMRRADAATTAAGIPGLVLMENAASRVVEVMEQRLGPMASKRIGVVCGKGNNGGDGLAVARQLRVRFGPREVRVLLVEAEGSLQGDAAAQLAMWRAVGGDVWPMPESLSGFDVIVDAVLGTGLTSAPREAAARAIAAINEAGENGAKVVAVDVPSGLPSDAVERPAHEFVKAAETVTFTAWKPSQVLGPLCYQQGRLTLGPIGTRAELLAGSWLQVTETRDFAALLERRPRWGHKGTFGHVLIIAGSRGKSGAAAMAGMAALRAGAGLVTIAAPMSAVSAIGAQAAELMVVGLEETAEGSLAASTRDRLLELAAEREVVAMGPGVGVGEETQELMRELYEGLEVPAVVDADALTALGTREIIAKGFRVLTPHPGEMSRLIGATVADVQKDRVAVARGYAEAGVTLLLKGDRTVIARADGEVWINPTGSPAMGTAGSGDVLTGMIAGLMAQHPDRLDEAVIGAAYLHGLAGERAAAALGEPMVVATDLLIYLSEAWRDAVASSGV